MYKVNPKLYADYYKQPYRHFHNLKHLKYVYESLKKHIDISFRLEALIVCHDMVYYPGCSQNEELSARRARYLFPDIAEYLTQGILATKNHDLVNVSEEFKHEIALFLDADMSILAADPSTGFMSEYLLYQGHIFLEFKEAGFTDEELKIGRLKFLNSFKGFITEEYKGLNALAFRNIQQEIKGWQTE